MDSMAWSPIKPSVEKVEKNFSKNILNLSKGDMRSRKLINCILHAFLFNFTFYWLFSHYFASIISLSPHIFSRVCSHIWLFYPKSQFIIPMVRPWIRNYVMSPNIFQIQYVICQCDNLLEIIKTGLDGCSVWDVLWIPDFPSLFCSTNTTISPHSIGLFCLFRLIFPYASNLFSGEIKVTYKQNLTLLKTRKS